jgi:polysaccharide biosynthesis transport protein
VLPSAPALARSEEACGFAVTEGLLKMSARDDDFSAQLGDAYSSSATPTIGVADILATLRRGWLFLALGCFVGLVLAISYLAYTPTLYRSSARLLIDLSVNRYLQMNKIVDEPTFHQAELGSQVYILSSESVVVPVVRALDLSHDPEFVGPQNAADGRIAQLKTSIKQLIGWNVDADPALDPEAALERKAVEAFLTRLSVYREDAGNVINVTFASLNPKKAANIANAVADTYIATTTEAKYNSIKTMSQWLQDRLKELKGQAIEADRALQNYKIANNLMSSGKGPPSVEEMARLNLQLTDARIAIAEAKARLDRIEQMTGEGMLASLETEVRLMRDFRKARSGSLNYALNNNDLARLRGQYRDLAAKLSEVESRVGSDHEVVVKLHKKMEELLTAIKEEELRIADSYANEYELAKAREKMLAGSLAQVVGETETGSQAQVKMRELESSADTVRGLYNSFLQKFNEISTVQSQNVPVQDARIVTRAAPQLQSSKKAAMVLAGGVIFGLLLGAGAAIGREWAADVFRTPKKVEQVTNKACVMLPMVRAKREPGVGFWGSVRSQPIEEFILDAPYSRFTESLRNIKALIDSGPPVEGAKVIGIVSSLAKEGKTTIAANLAALMISSSGARTLIIDADLHRRLLTAALAPEARQGLIEALEDPSRFASFIFRRERSGLDVLPCVLSARVPNAAELLGSAKMEHLLAVARKTYDYLIIEVAPIMSVVDIKMVERFIDSFIFVVEWGHTKRSLVLEALSETPNLHERVTGIVLNKTDPVALRSIEAYKGERFRNYYEE